MMARRRTRGFTLIELLVVITILGVLVALLVPAIWAGVRTANNARVGGDIQAMAQALASFKAKYGEYPPSRIVLVETGAYGANVPTVATDYYGLQAPGDSSAGMSHSTPYNSIGGATFASPTADLDYNALTQRSLRYMRKFFPRVNLSAGATPTTTGTSYYDFNGNGVRDTAPILLEGHECLVFFLGGVPTYSAGGSVYTFEAMGGFAKRPQNPFIPETNPLTGATEANRDRPFYEFTASRLIDDDLDGIPGYVDSLANADQARYFAYFSSYAGAGYDPNDVNFDSGTLTEPVAGQNFTLSFPVAGGGRVTGSPIPNPYTTGKSTPSAAGTPASFHSRESFQIISAGRDRLYGAGGHFDPTANTRLPDDPPVAEAMRTSERDNITSFHNGTLD